jgi:hypothetical protein
MSALGVDFTVLLDAQMDDRVKTTTTTLDDILDILGIRPIEQPQDKQCKGNEAAALSAEEIDVRNQGRRKAALVHVDKLLMAKWLDNQ